jgi:hypothetical protein
MVPDPFRNESVLVVVIDLAMGPLSSVGSMPQAELRANAGYLAEVCVLLDLPVLIARTPLPGAASTLLPEMERRLPRARQVQHTSNDSWEEPSFVDAVRSSGRRQLVFAGIATDVGVGLTALSALRDGYQAGLLTDVSGAVSERVEQAALLRLNQAGVVLTTWSFFTGEIQRDYTKGAGPQALQIIRNALKLTGAI